MGKIESILLDSIEILISNAFRNAQFDKTITGKINSSIGNGIYEVYINGELENIKAMDNKTYAQNDIVWVVIPCGNTSDKFILGKK